MSETPQGISTPVDRAGLLLEQHHKVRSEGQFIPLAVREPLPSPTTPLTLLRLHRQPSPNFHLFMKVILRVPFQF
ncbi:hypothetical protein AGIG_G6273 [Arapaima gigas]